MPPDAHLQALLDTLEADVATLRRYAQEVPWDAFVRSRDQQNMVLFALYRAAQGAVDIGQRALARDRLGAAATYGEVFALLANAGCIPQPLADRLYGWAGLRNVIAHLYRSVDLEALHLLTVSPIRPNPAFRATPAAPLTPSSPPSAQPWPSAWPRPPCSGTTRP
ncbi:MAG: DUF86 domain-containing protein [Deltaproteobacteria bacterium]|nr:DUF86 domain-containing protein [Deltaproteobacteria bacterium]